MEEKVKRLFNPKKRFAPPNELSLSLSNETDKFLLGCDCNPPVLITKCGLCKSKFFVESH